MKLKLSVLMASVFALFLVFCSGCGKDALFTDAANPTDGQVVTSEEQMTGESTPQKETELSPEASSPSEGEPSKEEIGVTSIGDSEFCTIKYPEELLDDVIVTESDQNGLHTTLFTAKIGESTYDLYAIYFGDGGEGELFGYMSSGEDEIPVYIKCYSLPENNSLQETEIMRFYEMMDAINHITESISSADGFMYS